MPFEDKNELETGPQQADPMLQFSGAHANPLQIGLATAAIVMVISLLFYGLNHQRSEEQGIEARAPAAPPTATTAAGPPAQPAQSQQNPGQAPQVGPQQAPAPQQGAQQSNPPATSGQGDQKQ